MKKEDLLIVMPTLLLVGAFIGSQIDDMFEGKTEATENQKSEWPLIKIVLVGAVGLIALDQGQRLIKVLANV